MALPTINDVQAFNPILTNLLVGYQQADNRFIAGRIWPSIGVPNVSGQYYKFTKKFWFVDNLRKRAPGTTYDRTGYEVETASFETQQWALSHPIPDEVRANSQVPMDLEQVGIRLLAQQSLIRKEAQFADTAMTTGVWGTDNTSATQWSDYASSDPVSDVRTARRTISQNTGQTANVMAMGEIVYDKLANHPDILERLKYVEVAAEAAVTAAMAAILGIDQIAVSYAIENTANTGQSASMSAIIDDDALIMYSEMGSQMMTPTAGKIMFWQPGGGTGGVRMVREEETDSDLIKHKEQWVMKVVASDVGYFLPDIVDA